jgi:hypothetical protein
MHAVLEEKTNEKKMFFFPKLDVGLKKKRGRDFLVFIYKNIITVYLSFFIYFIGTSTLLQNLIKF